MFGRTPTLSSGRAAGARAAGALALVLIAAVPAGCARLGLPVGGAQTDPTVTNGTRPATAALADPSDWEAIRRALATSLDKGDASHVEWTNPDTGSFGIVTATASATGAACRAFDTTMSDLRGVRRYSGEACKLSNGRWSLRSIKPADAALS